MDNKTKFYKTKWFMWVMLIFIAPVGIILMWMYHKDFSQNMRIILSIVFGIFFIGVAFTSQKQKPATESEKVIETTATPKLQDDIKEPEPTPETEQETEQDKTEKKEKEIPSEYTAALESAQNYSDMMHMSKQGIYDQLISKAGDNFKKKAAKYAIKHLKADWNANALESAKNYSDTMHMSKIGIYDQLISENGEKFTKQQAKYAIDKLKADYNANALAIAKSYRETMHMSSNEIYNQLISEYGEKFTKQQAKYAVKHLK